MLDVKLSDGQVYRDLSMEKDKSPKVIIIGLDGATFDVINPLIDLDQLPNLGKLMKSGSHGIMMSTIPPITAPAWTSLLTGANQAKHGLYNFIQRKENSYSVEVTNSTYIKAPTIFHLVNQAAKKIIAINVPYTTPPPKIDGIVVGGPFASEFSPATVHPPEIFSEIKKIEPDYFITPDYDSSSQNPLRDYANKLIKDIENKEKISIYMISNKPWDLFMTVFMATDEAQHAFWKDYENKDDGGSEFSNVIQNVYKRIDHSLGKILDAVDFYNNKQITVVIVSDHGGGNLRWMINLNKYLYEHRFLYFKTNVSFTKKYKKLLIQKLFTFYKDHLPTQLKSFVRRRLSIEHFEKIKGDLETSLLTSNIDWEKTKAYVLGAGGNIFINLIGREPMGIVNPGVEYETLLNQLTEILLNLRDPMTNDPLIEKVYKRNELYRGNYEALAPDLIVHWSDYSVWGRGRYDIEAPLFNEAITLDLTDIPLSGTHRLEGIFIASGPGINQDKLINQLSLLDVAPVALHQLGVPRPKYFDGCIPNDLFSYPINVDDCQASSNDEFPNIHTSSKTDSTDDDIEKIMERLRSLGYL